MLPAEHAAIAGLCACARRQIALDVNDQSRGWRIGPARELSGLRYHESRVYKEPPGSVADHPLRPTRYLQAAPGAGQRRNPLKAGVSPNSRRRFPGRFLAATSGSYNSAYNEGKDTRAWPRGAAV